MQHLLCSSSSKTPRYSFINMWVDLKWGIVVKLRTEDVRENCSGVKTYWKGNDATLVWTNSLSQGHSRLATVQFSQQKETSTGFLSCPVYLSHFEYDLQTLSGSKTFCSLQEKHYLQSFSTDVVTNELPAEKQYCSDDNTAQYIVASM